MSSHNQSSRRGFLEKVAVATAGLAITGNVGGQLFAREKQAGKTPFASDKKFVPVMLTPYKDNGSIDFDGLSRLMDLYDASGVKGYFANCASSEMYKLSPEERLSLARHVVKRVNGSVPVVATGSFGDSLEEKAEFTKTMYHTGVNAVILITSHFAEKEESDDILIRNFEKFLTLTDNIPVGTYECPSPYKRVITPRVFKYMLDSNRFIYHKDTTIDLAKVKEKIAMIKNSRLEFYDACVANTMYSLQAGAKGMSAICGNFYPDILVWMCNNSTNPARQDDVKWLQAELDIAEKIVGTNYTQSAKYFMQKRGVPINTSSRTASGPLTTEQKLAIDNLYKTFLGWCDRIGIKPAKV